MEDGWRMGGSWMTVGWRMDVEDGYSAWTELSMVLTADMLSDVMQHRACYISMTPFAGLGLWPAVAEEV